MTEGPEAIAEELTKEGRTASAQMIRELIEDRDGWKQACTNTAQQLRVTEDICVAELRKLNRKEVEVRAALRQIEQAGDAICGLLEIGINRLGPRAEVAAKQWRDVREHFSTLLPDAG